MSKILLAEDDDFLRTTTQTILEIAGYEVCACADGQQALDAFLSVLDGYTIADVANPRARPELIRILRTA